MTIEIRELSGEPIIVFHVRLPHTPEEDVRNSLQATTDFKKKWGGGVYRIVDLSAFNLTFSEAMMGMAAEIDREGGVNDLDVSTIYVGSSEMVKFGTKAFQEQTQYGETNIVYVCSTVNEGITFAREAISKK